MSMQTDYVSITLTNKGFKNKATYDLAIIKLEFAADRAIIQHPREMIIENGVMPNTKKITLRFQAPKLVMP